ncbi:leucine-rich melanocyte differentiation-associated protein-like isoform X1 [Tachypleus tridentatus]|uniref:leucine-rich melanocyte differentiation-associated protein-like isoform X1 n=1 Tax=Tachypleus tridentatus TaxID=6853 RepID=UPI003FD0611B
MANATTNQNTAPCFHKIREIQLREGALLWNDGQLSYIGQDCYKIPPILGTTYGPLVRRLDVSFNALRCLETLDQFTALEELVLDNNDLEDDVSFCQNPNLQTLSVNKNKFKDLDKLLIQLARCYPNLSYLSLLGNPACPDQLTSSDKDEEDYQRYRYYVIHKLPKLKFLDSTRVRNREIQEAQRIGFLMKVARPEILDWCEEAVENHKGENSGFSPLPKNTPLENSRTCAYGKIRHRYSGKNSEGNRFIRNNEL